MPIDPLAQLGALPTPMGGLSDTGLSDLEVLNGGMKPPGPNPNQMVLDAVSLLLKASESNPNISSSVSKFIPKVMRDISPISSIPPSTDLLPPIPDEDIVF